MKIKFFFLISIIFFISIILSCSHNRASKDDPGYYYIKPIKLKSKKSNNDNQASNEDPGYYYLDSTIVIDSSNKDKPLIADNSLAEKSQQENGFYYIDPVEEVDNSSNYNEQLPEAEPISNDNEVFTNIKQNNQVKEPEIDNNNLIIPKYDNNREVEETNNNTYYGKASYYADKFQGLTTANGERYDRNKMTAANKKLPFGTLCKVTNQANGKSVTVRVNDRGPYSKGRIIDLSYKAMSMIDGINAGVINVKMEVIGEGSSIAETGSQGKKIDPTGKVSINANPGIKETESKTSDSEAFYGKASYYADKFQGLKTANGELYDRNKLTAAHRKFPFGIMCKVTNQYNGKSVTVRVNDRGPYSKGRIIDLSYKAMSMVDGINAGVIKVKVEVIK